MVVPNRIKIAHLNGHNETSQNVMAVCDFDMGFTFVLAGWPGSAHDMRVFKDAVTTHHHKFPHPPQGLLLHFYRLQLFISVLVFNCLLTL
jgi:hypothetical protein